ncbi:MAG: hypothetical protein EBQ57_04575 [Actinobacteria bacterium]|nr:hypothetical protein [Actinomycetota bacterium]
MLVALAAMLPSLIGNRSGIGISWDSTDYIAVGLSMAAGRGALDVTGVPMVIRPPGLSALVTVGDWLTVSPDMTLRIVNAVAMFVVVWCTHRLLVRAQVRTVSLWVGVALVALSPALLDISTMAWSEPPFLALLLVALVIATRARTWPWDLVLAIVYIALFFVRYVGPFYAAPIALVAAVVQAHKSGVLLAFFRSATALAVSMVAPWLWLMRNKELSGFLTGYREPGGGTLLDPLRTLTGTLGSWLIARPPLGGNGGIYLNWADFSGYMKLAGLVVWVALIVLSVWFFVAQRDASPRVVVVAACLWVFVFYSSFSVYRFVYNEMGPLDSRMMSGVYVPLIIVFVVTLDRLVQSPRIARVALAVGVLVGAWHATTVVRDSVRYGDSGRHWGTEFHREVPIHTFARELPAAAALYSNEPQSLFAATFRWPIRNQYQYDQPALVDCDRRYFVWFNQSFLPDGKPVGGTIVYEDSWGQVIDLDRCDTDISRFWP